MLKIAAILDDPYRRAKDIDDVHALLKWYEWGEDRMYSEEVLTAELDDISLAPAFLLGLDVAALPPSKTERDLIERFLSIAIDEARLSVSGCFAWRAWSMAPTIS